MYILYFLKSTGRIFFIFLLIVYCFCSSQKIIRNKSSIPVENNYKYVGNALIYESSDVDLSNNMPCFRLKYAYNIQNSLNFSFSLQSQPAIIKKSENLLMIKTSQTSPLYLEIPNLKDNPLEMDVP